jgi:hypothetical protein
MFLFDVFSFNAKNDKAVNVARRMTASIKSMHGEPMGGDLDVFIAMTWVLFLVCIGICPLMHVNRWSFIANILIRESKRLQSLGDRTGDFLSHIRIRSIIH